MRGSTSLVSRVAWGSALSASAAALVAALATSGFAAWLVHRAEDRRLEEAAVTLARELDVDGPRKTVQAIVADEAEELEHTDLRFAVFDGEVRLLAGDARLQPGASGSCVTLRQGALRSCRAISEGGLVAVVASARSAQLPLLSLAALLAVALAALLAVVSSRVVSSAMVSPLSRLRARLAEVEVEALSRADVGEPEGVAEVDALRDAIGQLIVRVERSLEQAHRFAANAAHELRTPLTAARGELELLSEQLAEEAARASVQRARRTLDGLGTLVDRLLILALPTRAPGDAHETVSVRDLLEDAVASQPGAAGRVRLSEDDAQLHGDAVLLGTLVANALSNALKFGRTASVTLERVGSLVRVCVSDDGPGVAPADRDRVFEPFFRAENALRLRLPGHGLGLALIRHIARAHGGDAAFREVPVGACLVISFPEVSSPP